MPSKSTSSSSSERRWIYDVFLSFRGTDTRTIFISHLYNSLTNAGIYVFKDNEELRKGGQVSSLLMQAIQVSRISIIVFSKNYANSKSCLKELQRIMDCRRSIGQVVVPVFYNVEPSHVRHQRGAFGRSFQDLKKTISKNKAQLWGTALRDAASLTGFHLNNSRNESEDINKIIETITESLDNTVLFVAQHPVGVQPRAQHVIKLLNYQKSKDVMLLGILGIGGIGKTTIAKAIYNQIHRHFESYCFLSNIRELWEQSTTSQVYLQERLLSDIYKTTKIKIHNIESGIFILQQRLRYKRALLILDDVDKIEQLKALCGSREWFGPGSRIIITTRDEHLLKLLQVDHISRMPEMDQDESIQHFSWHAFKQPCPGEDFDQLSRNVVAYCGGLPLALEVIGSFLFDKKVREWGSVVDKLKRIPNDQVQRKLRISFDSLNDDTEKEIFLDIAFFFIGMDRNDVIHILDEYDAAIGISVLVDRSLVTIDNNNKLGMHDLLRDMGREIVREKSPKEPEERSRLWLQNDVYHVLSNHMGTKAIEGLTLKLTNSVSLEAKMFKMMKRLRLLQLAGVQLDGNFEDLPKHLRWLQWHECNLKYIPSNSDQASLVAIELEFSNLKFVWKEAKFMEKLKVLNLNHSHNLTQTPDFSYLPNLEKLLLKDCSRLSTISDTIGHLKKILVINLEDCTSLGNLPRSFYKLKSLTTLIISGCSMIDKLEEDLEQMESLITLIADKTAITQVPFSIVRSKSIGYVSLCGYEGFSRDVFPSLIWSWMSPTSKYNLSSMVQASSSALIPLDLPKLRSLWVKCDSDLQLNGGVARILATLFATYNKELEATPTTSLVMENIKGSEIFDLSNQSHNSESLKCLIIEVGMKSHATNALKDKILQGLMTTTNEFSDKYWLTFGSKGSSVVFEVPQMNGCNLKAVTLRILYSSSSETILSECLKNVLIINYTKSTIQVYKQDTLASLEDEEGKTITSHIEPGNKVEILLVGYKFIVKRTTVYLIYDEPVDHYAEHYQADVIVSSDNYIISSDNNDMEIDECSSVSGGSHDRSKKKYSCFYWCWR
ncbi:hypothetical protein HN51_022717 [Arachis hypogaea]|uniref:TIR domain-containing protein n=1 Tax=Arachis hypogaea TaxID=3818 RepID=A0A445EBN1_ARAHY|nr:TMV resistance protein N [Arachis hypogaea]QHO54035.1 TMV resistance protein N [Arachis hypogaea]RYR72655.1 hypothetical protein Ahy_A02g006883 [Arachis hypogaea]